MVNRTATYFGFDGLGKSNPADSDFRYYSTVQAWAAGKNIDFTFVNSHEKAGSVRDTSKLATLKASIQQRLRASKNMVVILSSDTRKSGSLLSYEIEKAVDDYNLPLIVAHTGYKTVNNPYGFSARWPTTLKTRIDNETAKAIHIPFKKTAILESIRRFSVNGEKLNGTLMHFTKETYKKWGYVD